MPNSSLRIDERSLCKQGLLDRKLKLECITGFMKLRMGQSSSWEAKTFSLYISNQHRLNAEHQRPDVTRVRVRVQQGGGHHRPVLRDLRGRGRGVLHQL